MGRISVLVPTEEMVHLSHNILQEGRFSDIQEVIQVSTEDAVAQAVRPLPEALLFWWQEAFRRP